MFFLKDFSFNTRGKLRNPIFGHFLIALYKEIELILNFFFLKDFSFNTRGKLRNPIFGNFLIALYKEIELILRSFFFLKDFNLILGGSFEIQFLVIF